MENLLITAMEELNEDMVMKLVNEKLAQGEEIYNIHKQLSQGLQRVGERYENGDYFIADLIVAGELIRSIMNLKGMVLPKGKVSTVGTIVVGTIFDDIHDVGKDIFVSMLKSAGFKTIDLGVDVTSKKFIQAIKKEKPDIVGISGVLTMIGGNFKKVVNDISAAGLRQDLLIIVGGAAVNEKLFKQLTVDAFSQDAAEGVKICLEWMKAKGRMTHA
jgi:methanogenic corrinoid protein MtbC1